MVFFYHGMFKGSKIEHPPFLIDKGEQQKIRNGTVLIKGGFNLLRKKMDL